MVPIAATLRKSLDLVFGALEHGHDAGSDEHSDEDDGDECVVHGRGLFSAAELFGSADKIRISRGGRWGLFPIGAQGRTFG